ncbi:hypothetical protein [Gramella sp. MAR_2010_147]|uniref:tellurite resistance TerB family protein n=1 Tax=Gramella sp. MAR_2010_147 TaxID=1250205 RepID=UPI00087ABF0A|nr:hypothetical protein [Gramella sp. MAR_2010_147]SDR90858.1 Uncharacterized conserved protein, tellurite resistance protein B (TerB) family [Gramella sp. MAR_2010_147]
MEFNLAEKLAIVKDIDRVILADNTVAKAEMVYLGQLMKLLDFDSAFVEEARKFNIRQANGVLENMSEAKKHSLAIILHEMAYADGEMSREEIEILFSVFQKAGIKIEEPGNSYSVFDASDVYFKSTKRRSRDLESNTIASICETKRAVRVEPHIDKGYLVTIFKLNGFLSKWGNTVEVAPKQMKLQETGKNRTILKGIEGSKDSHYSLSVFHENNDIKKIVMHHHNENKDVEYLI